VDLSELISAVELAGEHDPLARVSGAAALKVQIQALGDELLDHFVKDARAQGCSWTQIGDALGVTRQAAQQRHGGLLGTLVAGLTEGRFRRFTPRARAAVVAAQTAARDRRHASIDAEHLLLGVFDTTARGNVAVKVLARFGVDADTIERLVDERVPRGTEPVRDHIPFTARAKKILELALREALRLGHNYIGCEHIVLALRRDDKCLAARILSDQGVGYAELEAAVRDILTTGAA
jgi:Clp amino terminal domain, pathogenicity island component